MKRKISVLLLLLVLTMTFFACGKDTGKSDYLKVKKDEEFTVSITMEDSGAIKSMALVFYWDDDAFEIIEGHWLNHSGIIADFNKENKDAAIAFNDETNFCGDIFELKFKTKKDMIIIDGMFDADAVLKNKQETIKCRGISFSYAK